MKEGLREREQELRDEIKDFESERDNIRKIVGTIGGTPTGRARKVNIVFAVLVLAVFAMSLIWGGRVRFFMLELGILLLSIKLIFFLESFMKVNHFQFWILSSLEWRLDKVHKKLNELAKEIRSATERAEKDEN
jgi:hypothetical protein